jgi:UDP-N-acetyl-2-amino-2-deoxyglucuronate dehydrogenase
MNNNFALIGASGYIAPRHAEAIKKCNGNLMLYMDPHDNVGYIDRYFPSAKYFKEIERFDRELTRISFSGNKIDYVSVCSPNYLHDSHMRLGLRNGANVICEKPLVIKYDHLEMLEELENIYNKKIFTILQLRLHPSIINLKEKISKSKSYHKVNLDYITPRGKWYDYSWKGNFDKSGGVLFNIGVHFFDMLIWIFGDPIDFEINKTPNSSKGKLFLEHAEVDFFLSVDKNDLPHNEWKPHRLISVDSEELEFSEGFTELHNISYKNILNGDGFRISDVRKTIRLIEKMNKSER